MRTSAVFAHFRTHAELNEGEEAYSAHSPKSAFVQAWRGQLKAHVTESQLTAGGHSNWVICLVPFRVTDFGEFLRAMSTYGVILGVTFGSFLGANSIWGSSSVTCA